MGASLLGKYVLMCSVLMSSWLHVILAAVPVITDNFSTPTDDQGWNCGKIQKCGKFGNICGGFGVKGTGSDIKKTFTVPAGTYTVKLDFIKIDSWYGWSMLYTGACKVRVTRACLVSSTYRMFANIAATLPQGQRESIRQFERQNMLDPEL